MLNHIIFLIEIRLINEQSSKTMSLKDFINRKELEKSMEDLKIPKH